MVPCRALYSGKAFPFQKEGAFTGDDRATNFLGHLKSVKIDPPKSSSRKIRVTQHTLSSREKCHLRILEDF